MGTPEACRFTVPCAPKPRKSFIQLSSRMKHKSTDNLQGRELEKLQHAVKRFKFSPSTTPRSAFYGPNLKLNALCNLRLTDRTWAEVKNIITQNHHLVPPGLTKLKEYKKLTYLKQVEYSETEVKRSLFNMIKHSVCRVFEYLSEDEDNSIKGLIELSSSSKSTRGT